MTNSLFAYSSTYDPSPYGSATTSSSSDPLITAIVFGIFAIFVVVIYVVAAIFLGMMFKKAGIAPWKAWVPFYNNWIMFEMGGQKGWISLLYILALIPFLGLIPAAVATVFGAIAAYRIGLNFGKEDWFVLVYLLLGIVWFIWLAVDKTAVWQPDRSKGTTPPVQPHHPATS